MPKDPSIKESQDNLLKWSRKFFGDFNDSLEELRAPLDEEEDDED